MSPRSGPARSSRGGEPVAAAARFQAWRRERRRRYLRPLLVLVALACLLGVAAWVALGSSTFALRKVTVEGVNRLSAREVVDRSGLASDLAHGVSLVRIDTGAVVKRVESLPPVATAQVTRHWPHAVVIKVTERRPVAAVASGSAWMLVDLHGVAFATVSSAPAGLVPVQVGDAMSAGGAAETRAALSVYRALPDNLRRQVVQLKALSALSVTFQLRDGREVVWGSATDNARKLAVLRALLPRHATRYDVSTPDVAVTS